MIYVIACKDECVSRWTWATKKWLVLTVGSWLAFHLSYREPWALIGIVGKKRYCNEISSHILTESVQVTHVFKVDKNYIMPKPEKFFKSKLIIYPDDDTS